MVPPHSRKGGPTVNHFMSVFSQLLQLFPRLEFQRAVNDHRAERHARGFTRWGQFVAMLFCQLGRAKSFREICGGLACAEGKLSHLGITAPKRTTLFAHIFPLVSARPLRPAYLQPQCFSCGPVVDFHCGSSALNPNTGGRP